MRRICLFALALSAAIVTAPAAADAGAASPAGDALVFVVGASARPAAVSSADLRRMYLGQILRWPDGRRIFLTVRPSATAAGEAFFRRVAQMSEIDFSRLWMGALFRGEADAPPRVIGPIDELKRFLAKNTDALGFLLSSEIDDHSELRVLRVDGKLPDAAGYPYFVTGR